MSDSKLELLLDEPFLTTARQLVAVEELPHWNELVALFAYTRGITKAGYNLGWGHFCNMIMVHQALSYEFVEALVLEIKNLDVRGSIVEVCAGNGKLSYWLNQFGVPSIATDDFSVHEIKRSRKFVKQLSHAQALKRHNPELVIGCWMPGGGLENDILDYHSVKYYLDIGEGKGGCTGDDSLYERTDVTETLLEPTFPYSLSSAYLRINPSVNQSWAALFTKTGQFQQLL